MAPDDHDRVKRLLIDAVPNVDDTYVVVPARGGSWARALLPSIWSSSPRLLGIGLHHAVVVSTTVGFRKVKSQLWSGPKYLLFGQSHARRRIVRLHYPTGRLQIDGAADCRAVRLALRMPA